VIPPDKAAIVHEKHLVTTEDSRRMLGEAKSRGKRKWL
jgi:hypothetical protein